MQPAFTDFRVDALNIEQFDCGDEQLNRFIVDNAATYVNEGFCAVRILIEQESGQLIGYSAFSPTNIPIDKLPVDYQERYKIDFPVPAWLIGRLAVSKQFQGYKWGEALLFDAMQSILGHADKGAGALIVVDAKNKKVKKFYKKYKFVTLPTGGLRLIKSMHQVRHLLS